MELAAVFPGRNCLCGAILASYLAGAPPLSADMGALTSNLAWPVPVVPMFLLLGGFLMGLGARLAGDCTSGHSIDGVGTLQGSSVVVTLLFLAFGALSANLIPLVLYGGLGGACLGPVPGQFWPRSDREGCSGFSPCWACFLAIMCTRS